MADYSALTARPDVRTSEQEDQQASDYSALTRRPMSVGEDVVRSGLSGLQRGVVGLLGLPGDIRNVATQLGVPENIPLGPLLPQGAPTSQRLQSAYEGLGGPVHEPQTTAGEYARTVGEFAPAAIGGAGSLLRRGAQAVIPALSSETAGQVARQVAPEYETAARVAAGVGTAVPAARAGASRLPRGAAPETDELSQMAKLAYDRAEQAGLVIKPDSFSRMVTRTVGDVRREGIDKTIHPKATAAAMRLVETVKANQPMTLQQFDTMRRVVRAAAKSTDADERRLANIMIERMDDYLDGMKAKDISAGDLRMAASSLKEARSLWRRMRKSEMIDDALERAGVRAGQFSLGKRTPSAPSSDRWQSR